MHRLYPIEPRETRYVVKSETQTKGIFSELIIVVFGPEANAGGHYRSAIPVERNLITSGEFFRDTYRPDLGDGKKSIVFLHHIR